MIKYRLIFLVNGIKKYEAQREVESRMSDSLESHVEMDWWRAQRGR